MSEILSPGHEEQLKGYRAPKTVDFNVNGLCNLDCAWCWGPPHDKSIETVSTEEWIDIGNKLNQLGTKNVVITGGETLLKKNLEYIVSYLHKDLGMRTTLSTNGILLRQRGSKILPFIDDIGIPLDGFEPNTNNIMRRGTPIHFERSLDAMKMVQQEFPNIQLTVRTVVARPNIDTIHLIGSTITNAGVDPDKLRWKLYQCTPVGPRQNEINNGEWLISDQEFEEAIQNVRQFNANFPSLISQSMSQAVGRYFHINPDGTSKMVCDNGDGVPYEIMTGDINANFDEVIRSLNEDYNLLSDPYSRI